MTLSQTSLSTYAKGVTPGVVAYRGKVTLPVDSTEHTVSSVSSHVSLTTAYVVQTSTRGFVVPPNVEAEAEWRMFQFLKVTDPAYEPARTPLGKELRRLRRKIIESGQPLLDWDDIERLTAQLRGERS